MDKSALDFVIEKTHELINAPTCSRETKAAAQDWLDAVGTEKEAAETKKYIDELEADIMPIDNLIGFAESDAGSRYFGADAAKNIAAPCKGHQGRRCKFLRLSGVYRCGCDSRKKGAPSQIIAGRKKEYPTEAVRLQGSITTAKEPNRGWQNASRGFTFNKGSASFYLQGCR